MLWGDGQLLNAFPTSIKDESARIIVDIEDDEGMKRFLATVRGPTFTQRVFAKTISDVAYTVMAWTLCFGCALLLQFVLRKLWSSI